MDDTRAKLTEQDGRLVVTIRRPDDPPVENMVLRLVLPLLHGGLPIAFYDMPHERAMYYSTQGIVEVIRALAEAGIGAAEETEEWYSLTVWLTGRAVLDREKVSNDLAKALDKAEIGWLNPIILTLPGNVLVFDLALSDEPAGRAIIENLIHRRWGCSWKLDRKPDGLSTQPPV
jgi:hypothetical protein